MADVVRVLVLYDHPLLGEGLSALLASEPDLDVDRICMGDADAMARAIATDAEVVILEDGGSVGLLDVLRSCGCRAIVDVSMGTSRAWTIHREEIEPDPESLIDRIVGACLGERRLVAPVPVAG
jgi:hypothetical protein